MWSARATTSIQVIAVILIGFTIPLALSGCGMRSLPLATAAGRGDLQKVSELLRASDGLADLDVDSALRAAARNGHTETALVLVDAGASLRAAMYTAVESGDKRSVATLLQAGANPSAGLREAVERGHADVLAALIEAGANPTARLREGRRRGPILYVRPIHLAAWRGHAAAVRTLIAAGAECNAKAEYDYSLAEGLASLLADVMINPLGLGGDSPPSRISKDQDGWTPLDFATSEGHGDVVETLIETCAAALKPAIHTAQPSGLK